MRFAPVLPSNLYCKLDHGSYHMVQAHILCEDAAAMAWFQDRIAKGCTVILDNGTVETGEPQIDALIAVAEELHPTIIIVPDLFDDKTITLELFYEHLATAMELAPQVMIVPHGKDPDDWSSCGQEMIRSLQVLGYPFIVGVPKVLDRMHLGRAAAMYYLQMNFEQPLIYHLLGIWSNMNSAINLGNLISNCIGIDTTLPYAAACEGIDLNTHRGKVKMLQQYWDAEPGKDVLALAASNIDLIRRLLHEKHGRGEMPGMPIPQ